MATVMSEHLWDRISSYSVIKACCKELKALSAKPYDASEWAMVGHGVVDYPLDLKTYLPLIGRDAGFSLVSFDAEKLMDTGACT